jgi:hypothetical protein
MVDFTPETAVPEITISDPSTAVNNLESPPVDRPEDIVDPEACPQCFKSTVQECLFVLTATMSIGTSSFLYGICTVITAPIGRSLSMTAAEITWINASSA